MVLLCSTHLTEHLAKKIPPKKLHYNWTKMKKKRSNFDIIIVYIKKSYSIYMDTSYSSPLCLFFQL